VPGPPGATNGFRRTTLASLALTVDPTPLAIVAPAPGAYLGGATTTLTGGAVAASVTCTISDGGAVLNSSTTTIGGATAATVPASVQLGVFTASSTLTFACSSDQPDVTASNTVLAGLSLDAVAESP
jgi:hypothetical protein